MWLIGSVIMATLAVIFSAHYIDINNTITLGRNPWIKIGKAGVSIYSIFMSIPFLVLFISAALHIEHQNNGFKQLYSLPKNRGILIFYKMAALLICVILSLILLMIGLIVVGYILNFIYPETGFTYHRLPFLSMIKSFCYVLISMLGIVGIQFFLSLRFKGFLVPASIGVLAFIFALLLGSMNNPMSQYFPYCYPIIAKEHGAFDTSELGIAQDVLLNSVEISSISVFIVFMLLSYFLERKRNI